MGLNGVGVKAVNALSAHFEVKSYRDGKVRALKFERGNLTSDITEDSADENGTYIFFEPDPTLFVGYSFHDDFVETMLRNYTYLNSDLPSCTTVGASSRATAWLTCSPTR